MAKSNKKARKIYMDYASGATPSDANPGSIHALGLKEASKLASARGDIARILGARSQEIIFTSGATESNNLAILGTPPGHVVITNIEHPSVLEPSKARGNVASVPVESNGIVDPKKILKALTKNTVLVSVMYANNEIGTVQPIKEIAKVIRHFNKLNNTKIFFHTDATQAVNYLPINVLSLGVDMLSFNAAKIYGPKGIGALYKRRTVPLVPIMYGGDQEGGLRPGTENVAGAVELSLALTRAEQIKNKEIKRMHELKKYFFRKLQGLKFPFILNGDFENSLPNILNITFPRIPSDLLVIELSERGIMTSAKSACKSTSGDGSYVIEAINPKADSEVGGVRFSLGRETAKKDIEITVNALKQILTKLERWYN